MGLSEDLIKEFAKITNDDEVKKGDNVVYGTVVSYSGKPYVRLDGSDQLTPVSTTSDFKIGDRVKVTIGNHTATVTGNVSSPSARKDKVDELEDEIGTKITEFEIIIADKVSMKELEAERGRIDNLVSDNVIIRDTLTAHKANIDILEADRVVINQKLEAQDAKIQNLDATKLSAEIADLKFATIEDLEVTDANIHNLEADYGAFHKLATDKFSANDAAIKRLDTEKLSTETADMKYANIDFANIGEAAVKKIFADSGLIKDLIVGDGTITGELIGVTIKGDLIEGGTVIADKLVIKGEDGLYYKLNTDGVTTESEQTDYNSLNGSIITAKSITAKKIAVDDLVAFDATIGGFTISESSIYSGVKSSANNGTRGVYMDREGQFSVGDASNFLKYYRDENGDYRLQISANSLKFSASGEDVESIVGSAIVKSVDEFYLSDSPLTLTGGSWSTEAPSWEEGKYLWRRTAVTYGNGSSEYTPSPKGVCITGNTGASGEGGGDIKIGGRNLVLRSGVALESTEYIMGSYNISSSEGDILDSGFGHLVEGETYAVSICVSTTEQTEAVGVALSSSLLENVRLPTDGTASKQVLSGTFKATYAENETPVDDPSNGVVTVVRFPNDVEAAYDSVTLHWIKIEHGNKPSDWTPAPEDIFSDIKNAQDAADTADMKVDNAVSQIEIARSDFEILKNSISSLVTDQNGESLMTQTSNGWTFNMGSIISTVENAVNDVHTMQGTVDEVSDLADRTSQLANDIAKKTAYINMSTDDDGNPCIELGKVGNDFKVRITNTAIDFMQGSQKIAYITNQSLYIQSSVVTDELKIGDDTGFIWKKRSNGNMGLRWMG